MILYWSQTPSFTKVFSCHLAFHVLVLLLLLSGGAVAVAVSFVLLTKLAWWLEGLEFPESRQRIQKIPWIRATHAPIDRLLLLPDTDPSGFNWFRFATPRPKNVSSFPPSSLSLSSVNPAIYLRDSIIDYSSLNFQSFNFYRFDEEKEEEFINYSLFINNMIVLYPDRRLLILILHVF